MNAGHEQHYSKQQASELLRKYFLHRSGISPIESGWAQSLTSHLQQRNLQGEALNLFQKISAADPQTLKADAASIESLLLSLQDEDKMQLQASFDPVAVVSAGRLLKKAVIATLSGIVLLIALLLILGFNKHLTEGQIAGASILVLLLTALVSLALIYAAGQKLEQAVRNKNGNSTS